MSSFDPRQMFSPFLKGSFWTPVKAISRPPLSADQTVCESFETLYITPFFREWVKAKEKEIYVLLNETPPNGAKYTKFIKHLLEREGHWVKWKNDGCPKFMKEKGKWVQSFVLAVSGLFNWKVTTEPDNRGAWDSATCKEKTDIIWWHYEWPEVGSGFRRADETLGKLVVSFTETKF